MAALGTAAWPPAAKLCSDLICGSIGIPEWRLEVVDDGGTVRHLFRLTAENLQALVVRDVTRRASCLTSLKAERLNGATMPCVLRR